MHSDCWTDVRGLAALTDWGDATLLSTLELSFCHFEELSRKKSQGLQPMFVLYTRELWTVSFKIDCISIRSAAKSSPKSSS